MPFGEHRTVELHREACDRVAAVVALREQDRVGLLLAGELRDRRRGDLAGKSVARIDHEELRRAMLAGRRGNRVGVGAGVDRFDRRRELAGLGQDLQRGRGGLAVRRLGEHPDLVDCHDQTTFSCSRNATTFSAPVPSSSNFSPA